MWDCNTTVCWKNVKRWRASNGGPEAEEASNESFYVDYVARDLSKLVDYVVPRGNEGAPNLMSATQVGIV